MPDMPMAARVLVRDLGTARPASQLHGTVAETGHIRAGTPEGSCHDRHVPHAIPEDPRASGPPDGGQPGVSRRCKAARTGSQISSAASGESAVWTSSIW